MRPEEEGRLGVGAVSADEPRRATMEERLREHVKREVDKAPPLPEEQKARLATGFGTRPEGRP